MKKHKHTKLGEIWDGPFEIDKIHVLGNVTVNLRDGMNYNKGEASKIK